MGPPSHLKSLQALELAVRTGSFAAAADILAITPAAVGQRVKALEDYLGMPYPTQTGQRTGHGFVAKYRPRHTTAPTVDIFRAWLRETALRKRDWLESFIGG
jgi:hypothetical protein